MLDSRSGFITQVKQRYPEVIGTHCMIKLEPRVSKKKNCQVESNVLTNFIKVVNYVKWERS